MTRSGRQLDRYAGTLLPPNEVRIVAAQGRIAHVLRRSLDSYKLLAGTNFRFMSTLCGVSGVYEAPGPGATDHLKGCGRCYRKAAELVAERGR